MQVLRSPHPVRWIQLALVYFLAAVVMGVVMAASHDHRLKGVHVHMNLLGWVSMMLFAWVYQQFPRAAASWAAAVHFWLYNLTLPLMMVALARMLLGDERLAPVIAVGSLGVLLAVALFVGNVLHASLRAPSGSAPASGTGATASGLAALRR